MSAEGVNIQARKSKSRKRIIAASALTIALLAALAWHILAPHSRSYTRTEELAKQFYHVDDEGLHWDYDALSRVYCECSHSIHRQQLLELMVKSRATHLVPQIIDSIRPGGFMDAEREIRTIIELTGHDFSEDFDIRGIWQKEHVAETKELLRQWWERNSQEVMRSGGPKNTFNPPNHWPSLTLELRTEKAQYVQLEPIRVTTILKNNSDTWFTFTYKLRKPAFAIEYYRVLEDGNLVSLGEMRHPARWIICGNARRWFTKPSFLVIDGASSHVSTAWLTEKYHCTWFFEPGELTIRAVLTPLRGEHKGKRLISNDLNLRIARPQGIDAQAFKFIVPREAMDTSNGRRFGLGFSIQGGQIHCLAGDLLSDYGDSVYANYIRYTQATTSRYPPHKELLREKLTEIVNRSPRDFSLLADSYAHLLEYYKEQGQLDKMSTLAESIKLEDLEIADPRLLERLTNLIRHPHNVESQVNKKSRFGITSLHHAAEKGPPPLVKFLISKGANVNAKDYYARTPLCLAARAGHKKIVEILISNGADVNIREWGFGRRLLFWPVVNGHTEIVEMLLKAGANINVQDNSGRTPVHWAARNKRKEILSLLVKASDKNGWTHLHWAVHHGKKALVHLLLSNGARADIKDNNGRTPLDIAVEYADRDYDRKAILYLVREYGENQTA